MKKVWIVISLVLFVWLVASCVVYPVMPQADVDARHTAQAEVVLPTVTLAAIEATATAEVEATAVVIATEEAPQVACDIKINNGKTGLVYHLPGGAYYDRVKIDISQGDSYACTEQEAVDAGARKSSR